MDETAKAQNGKVTCPRPHSEGFRRGSGPLSFSGIYRKKLLWRVESFGILIFVTDVFQPFMKWEGMKPLWQSTWKPFQPRFLMETSPSRRNATPQGLTPSTSFEIPSVETCHGPGSSLGCPSYPCGTGAQIRYPRWTCRVVRVLLKVLQGLLSICGLQGWERKGRAHMCWGSLALVTWECQAEDPGCGGELGWPEGVCLHPSLTRLSLAGHCPALPLSQKHVSCEGWLHHVWVPQAAAHVPHSDDRNGQPHPVHRWCLLLDSAAILSHSPVSESLLKL